MIPLPAILFTLTAAIALGCSLILVLRRMPQIEKDVLIRNLLFTFLISAIYFSFESLPTLLTKNSLLIEIFFILGDTVIIFAPLCFLTIILRTSLVEKASFYLTIVRIWLIFFSLFYAVYSFLKIEPACFFSSGSIYVWSESASSSILYLHGAVLLSSFLAFIIFTVYKGWFHNDYFIKKRARLLVAGCFLVFLGGIMIYICQLFIPEVVPRFKKLIPAFLIILSLFFNSGYILLLKALLLQRLSEENKK